MDHDSNISINPDSIFDMQVKRIHEYKRQHLNALHILTTYQFLRENPNIEFSPKTYIFSGKAAPGYYFAKQIIKFIVQLGHTINNDPKVRDLM
jgi:starch phosphorylase